MKNNDIQEYPHLIVGAFIFNDKGELFMMKAPKWKGRYVVPGGHAEVGEKMEEALLREVKEETDMELTKIELMSVTEAPELKGKTDVCRHMVFMNYYAKYQGDDKDIKLNNEATKHKWQTVDKWLKDKKKIGMASLEVLEERHWERLGLKEKYHRALADYQNLLKRCQTEKEEHSKYAREQFILEVLPVYDNLKVSLEHIDEAAQGNGWAEGIKFVVKQFKDILEGMGVAEIEAIGKKFDPNIMEAVEGKGDTVKAVVKPGYRLKGKVIMPARVVL